MRAVRRGSSIEEQSPAVLPLRDALRRRRHRPARHPHRARHLPVRVHRQRPIVGHRPASGCSGHERRRSSDCSSPTAARSPRRVFRTCRALGIETVAVHSDADADAALRARGRRRRPPARQRARRETYLRVDAIVDAARRTGADAIHPGYGFLSENAAFARAVRGRRPHLGRARRRSRSSAMGSKIGAKRAACAAAGVPVLEATRREPDRGRPARCSSRPSAGGGGRGMRIVRALGRPAGRRSRRPRPRRRRAFGDGTVFVERYVERGRHVEVQVLGDEHGARRRPRRARLLDPAPPPEDRRGVAGAAAARGDPRRAGRRRPRAAAQAIGYRGAGTVEFLSTPTATVLLPRDEHPAPGRAPGHRAGARPRPGARCSSRSPRPGAGRARALLGRRRRGHAIEVRLYAEDPADDFAPQTGRARPGFEIPAGAAASGSTPASRPAARSPPTTTRCWPR